MTLKEKFIMFEHCAYVCFGTFCSVAFISSENSQLDLKK